jgi:hypothetical protein
MCCTKLSSVINLDLFRKQVFSYRGKHLKSIQVGLGLTQKLHTGLKRLAGEKHSSLLGPLVSYERRKFNKIRP